MNIEFHDIIIFPTIVMFTNRKKIVNLLKNEIASEDIMQIVARNLDF